jgi:exopolyphosphatase/guanosine-5'-triphosphate,3'-diphosphate pyrophosphatase
MRVAVVDIGSNSTRLLIADVAADASVTELTRRSNVTRLGDGVDSSGRLSDEAMARVTAVLDQYRAAMDELNPEINLAVLTSAVRDAANGKEFTDLVRGRYKLDARTLTGDEEAQLTFLGATSDRPDDSKRTVVIDIGGGSTEFIIGTGHKADFHVSTQSGVVRMSERHIHSDPPPPDELQALTQDTRAVFDEGVPEDQRAGVQQAIAVAGTATSAAAIDQELDPYDPEKVHGYKLSLGTVELLLARLAAMTNDQRRHVAGLHPDRAPTIVAGMILLAEAIRTFGLDEVEVSEHDILRGGALRLAGRS